MGDARFHEFIAARLKTEFCVKCRRGDLRIQDDFRNAAVPGFIQ